MRTAFKTYVAVMILFLVPLVCFAGNQAGDYFASRKTFDLLPVESEIGQVVPFNESPEHEVLYAAITEPYEFEWCEKYLSDDIKGAVTSLFSGLFSEILPASRFVFSEGYENGDGSISITVKFTDTGVIISFVLKEDKICALSVGRGLQKEEKPL